MKNILKNLYSYVIFISVFSYVYSDAQAASEMQFFYYQFALVRDLSESFENSLKLNPPIFGIDLLLAKQQHEDYINLLKKLVPNVIQLKADLNHPDCNFIEDTAIIVDDIVVISRMGAVERRGEEIVVADAFEKIETKNIVYLQAPATMDGGDVLYTGKHLFVGISHRTNEHALNQLKDIFKGKIEVIGIPVTQGLHLKSIISLFDSQTLIVTRSSAGIEIQNNIESKAKDAYNFISVPDSVASNVLRIGSTLIVQEGFLESEAILQNLCDQKLVTLVKLNMSELIKADGALTCGSLLFN